MNEISVLMSVNNAEEPIAESIESVISQSFSDLELIIVSHCSTDHLRSIISRYHDKRILLLDHEKICFQSLNAGLNAATGKYVARMNAEDLMHIDFLKILHSIMEDYTKISVCGCWYVIFGQKMPVQIPERQINGIIDNPLIRLLIEEIQINPIYVIRSSFLKTHNVLFEQYPYAEDYKLWVEMAKMDAVFYVEPQLLSYKRSSDFEISGTQREEHLESKSKINNDVIFSLCKKHKALYPSLTSLYDACSELLKQNLISENEMIKSFSSLFLQNRKLFFNNDYQNQIQII